jgi:hypothetical protein
VLKVEVTIFVINFLWIFVLANVLFLVARFIFNKHKQLISVIYNFILLIMIHYFIIAQRDYIFDEYPKIAYPLMALMLLAYYIFFRELYSLIKTKKLEKDTSANNIR